MDRSTTETIHIEDSYYFEELASVLNVDHSANVYQFYYGRKFNFYKWTSGCVPVHLQKTKGEGSKKINLLKAFWLFVSKCEYRGRTVILYCDEPLLSKYCHPALAHFNTSLLTKK